MAVLSTIKYYSLQEGRMEPITMTALFFNYLCSMVQLVTKNQHLVLRKNVFTMNVVRSENVVVKLFFERKIMFVFTWSEVIVVSRAQASSCTTCRR
jgi:hypothetical protein